MITLRTTRDLLITNQLHYRLCYTSIFSCMGMIKPNILEETDHCLCHVNKQKDTTELN